jgi:hypothetical protein
MRTLEYTGDTHLATTTTTTTSTTTTTQPFDPGGSGGTDPTGGYSDGGYTGTEYPTATTPSATPTSSPASRRVTPTTQAKVAKLAGLRLPDSGDRLVLPVVLGLALLALVVRLAESTRSRVRGWRLRR